MKIIDQHIGEYLDSFINSVDFEFCEIYNDIQHPHKETAKSLLVYLDKIVNILISRSTNQLQFNHLHFAYDDEITKLILAEYLVIKFFKWGIKKDLHENRRFESFKKLYRYFEIIRSNTIPSWVSAKSRSKEVRDWNAKDKRTKEIFKFLKNLYKTLADQSEANLSFYPYMLLNMQKKLFTEIIPLIETRLYAVPISELTGEMKSYVLPNTTYSRDEIDRIKLGPQIHLMDCIEHVIIFDCEQKRIFREFNLKELNEWNNNGSSFKNIFLISFGDNEPRFQWLKSCFDRINSRYYQETQDKGMSSHLITSSEVNSLFNKKRHNGLEIDLWGEARCSYWDEFSFRINHYEGLYELRSIKMKNLYSLVLNEDIKRLVLHDIFASNSPELISIETFEVLKEIPTAIFNEIKWNLELTLDWIISSGWPEYLKGCLTSDSLVLLPSQFKPDSPLTQALIQTLPTINPRQVRSWFNIDFSSQKQITILEYRDSGYFPYRITPNIFEDQFPNSPNANGIFLKLMFSDKYRWTLYNMSKGLMRLMQNPIRAEHFAWDKLNNKVKSLRPEREDDLNWDLESSYQPLHEYSSINIAFKTGRDKTYNPSELLIVASDNIKHRRVKRADELLTEDLNEVNLYVQGLDEIYAGLNLYEKLANTKREENDLQIIRKAYQLEESEAAGRLWKVLLKRKVDEKGASTIYNELDTFLEKYGLSIVSFHTFQTIWANPYNESLIPREKRVFLKLCEYLELSPAYVRIMLRLKNAERQATMNSSKQMNNLLFDLFNDGCFDNGICTKDTFASRLEIYVKKHDFDEIGIGKEHIATEINALIELLKPNIELQQITSIEKN